MSAKEPSLDVVIKKKSEVATNIVLFELCSADGGVLPPCELGSHIAVETPSGANRWYSVCEVSEDNRSYYIAVKREDEGRGGSISMLDHAEEGSLLRISEPECEFEFVDAPGYLMIAGGIGITPIYAMWKHLVKMNHPHFKLVYLSRSPADAPFLEELSQDKYKDHVLIHHSAEAGKRYDFWDLLEKPTAQHIYCCGPKSLMTEIKDMTGHWPQSRLHFEDFKPVEAVRKDDKPFRVRVAGADTVVEVSESETMLDALRKQGIKIHSSCESGTCGSCKVTVVEGLVDHRDLVLEESEMKTHMMACVSRAEGDEVTIDIQDAGVDL
ncbi:2Fe-2S iron-sulfur cluster-binding protein [Litorivivens sp.]|jgi:phthalate 4,5-dioxygenase reductase subunit|uniref:PDR/VanB family oxidoreductase n=1 Tax=Litorivivens sp. TaxID=2020868 RepID=UPI000C8CAE4C|nr:phthalate 4,5-dioxygenase [Gammaproteobacteria bacterium]|tara:strand:- start:305 stop:1279 length:975 start_codon:yes stop_codon:yes gene_type:complete